MSETFLKSCQHWSSDYSDEMTSFYKLATVDYEHLGNSLDWEEELFKYSSSREDKRLKILDVACGSGKFPSVIQKTLGKSKKIKRVDYSILDPSLFALEETKKNLKAPFFVDEEFNSTIQDFKKENSCYDVSWAMHALYAIPPQDIIESMRIFKETFRGVGYIAHAREKSHYIEFQKIFLSGFKKNKSVRYTTSEDIMAALDQLGIKYEERILKYENKAESNDRLIVEAYLQRCIFDDTITLEDLENNTQTRDYILQCKDQNGWSFNQEVSLIRVL